MIASPYGGEYAPGDVSRRCGMTFKQLLAELGRRGIVFCADRRLGVAHFDSPSGVPTDILGEIERHQRALVRLGPFTTAPAAGRAN